MMDSSFITAAAMAIASFSIPLHVMYPETVAPVVSLPCQSRCDAFGSVRLSIRLFIQSWLGIIGQTNECHRDGTTGAAVSLQLSPC